MAYFDELAGLVTRTRTADLPPAAVAAARDSYLDTVAVMVAGRRAPVGAGTAGAAPELGGPGRSSVVGGERVTAPLAALVNATCAHAEDFDDATLAGFGGHASAVLVPATLAVGEQVGATGAEVVAAYAVGYECILAVAEVMNPPHYEQGFHPTSTLGVLGAAAAASRLYRLSRDRTAVALAIAASFASGIKANFGTETKPLHCGRAAEGGITAAILAGRGLSANPGAFEARQGFRKVFGGRDVPAPVPAPGTAGWRLVDPGVGLRKAWPCCGSIHTTIEAVLHLREQAPFTAEQVDHIECALHERRLPHTDRPQPQTGDEARFSVQACAAMAAVDGRVGVDSFRAPPLARPEVKQLVGRVAVVADPAATAQSTEMDGGDFGARVTVRLTDGRVLTHALGRPLGSPERPLPAGWLDRKFADCVRPLATEETYRRLHAATAGIAGSDDVGALGEQLRAAGVEGR